MLDLPKKVKSGDPVTFSDHNKIIDCLQSLLLQPGVGYRVKRSAGGVALDIDKVNVNQVGGAGCALKPTFSNGSAGVIVSFRPSYVVAPVGRDGLVSEVVPMFEDEAIMDDGSEDWEKPVKLLDSEAEYFVWMSLQGKESLLVVGEEDDRPDAEAGKQIFLLAGFEVVSEGGRYLVRNVSHFTCPQFKVGSPLVHEGFPTVYDVGDGESPDWKVRFSAAFVTDGESGQVMETSTTDDEFGCVAGDVFYLNHTVGVDGVTSGFSVVKDSSPQTIPHNFPEETPGVYYYKLATILAAGDGSLFADVNRSAGVLWHPNLNDLENAADAPTDGAEVVVRDESRPWLARVLAPHENEGGVGVDLKWAQDGTTITPTLEPVGGEAVLTFVGVDGNVVFEWSDGMLATGEDTTIDLTGGGVGEIIGTEYIGLSLIDGVPAVNLVNKGDPFFSPDATVEKVGFYRHYAVQNGEVGEVGLFGTRWQVLPAAGNVVWNEASVAASDNHGTSAPPTP